MTSFRIRVLAFILLVFAAIPALAQESTAATVNPLASLGCLLTGLIALGTVGFLAHARESQDEQALTIQSNTPDAAPSTTSTL